MNSWMGYYRREGQQQSYVKEITEIWKIDTFYIVRKNRKLYGQSSDLASDLTTLQYGLLLHKRCR